MCHKTHIKVGEVGTEATAATVIGIVATGAPMAEPPVIQFNRPFLYFIMEKQIEVILFMGTVINPSRKDRAFNLDGYRAI